MTARTANEQLIAFLECQVVTMRVALENSNSYFDSKMPWVSNEGFQRLRHEITKALASADYANKVVVDREEWNQLWIIANDCQFHLNKLDSLRKADEATAAVHIEGGKT